MDKRAIKEIAMRHSLTDLDTIYAYTDEVLFYLHQEQEILNTVKALALSDTLHLIQSGVRHDNGNDLEQGLELLRSVRDKLLAPPKYLDDTQLLETKSDPINPNHYKTDSGVECIDIAELFPYSLGNAIKYAWRAGKKGDLKQDLEKCKWYLNRARLNVNCARLNGTANDPNGREHFLKQDLEKCEWYLNRAIANGEDNLFLNNDKSVLQARRLFAKLNRTDLPELNYELIDRILNVSLEYALTHIDDCFVGER